MALQKKQGELPPDAVLLTEAEAITYQWKVIYTWKEKKDLWPFFYGYGLMGGSSALAGLYINSHYRNRMRLFSYARMSTYFPIVVLPALMSTFFHQQLISNDILIQKSVCPLCVQLKAAAIQGFFGTVYPTILAPLACFTFAARYNTYKIPSFTENPKAVWSLWSKLTKPIGNTLFSIFILQALFAMWLTHRETKSYIQLQEKLLDLENRASN